MERFEAVISGRVQTVLYRDFTQKNARNLGIVGEVTNMPDKTVRVIAEGKKETLLIFLAHLHKGPLFAFVTTISVTWKPSQDLYTSFEITSV